MPIDDREPAWILADALVLGTGELNEPGAPQPSALAHEAQQARVGLAGLHSLVDLAEGRLVHRDPLLALAFHP